MTIEEIFTSENPNRITSWEVFDITQYKITVSATQSFVLSFSEIYDPAWIAYSNGIKIDPLPIYPSGSGFWINQTGQLEITIEYTPQEWFKNGLIISGVVFFLSCTYVVYTVNNQKSIIKRIKRVFNI